ncbi:hypothetical protein DW757_07705 [Clostridium sp. AM29-11AC]|mgnify:CR=1 FL=1|uniref:hypothetical protein n=1 Tax=Clostridium sp. AM29-11AC TaxID=2293028 RepID=UPI000E54B11B|nr:hypothetical protein [Clostridium sp. AM29-11AC]RHT57046.1 hypothetical protein DW757_07705 [Clostridium sp. AM29-11AC]
MKFTIGTASSNMEFEEDYKLIKSALLYADEIELIGMAEYAIYNYLPKCFSNANDIEKILTCFIPFLNAFDNENAKEIVQQLNSLTQQIDPYMPYLRKKHKRNKQEIFAQIKMHQVEKICKASLETEFNNLLNQTGARQIQNLIDRKIITVYDYSYTGFSVDELTGGYFGNLLGTIKHGKSYPLFDNISSEIVGTVINSKIIDFSKTDKEIIRHAGIANNILSTLPTLEKATVDEILDFKKEMKIPLENFRTAIYNFSERITSMPWDDDFQYECIKLYDTEVIPKVNELNELSSNTSVLKNFGNRVLADEEERRRLGYVGAGLITTITTDANIVQALGVLENLIRTGAKVGLTAAGVTAFLKTADLVNQAYKEVKEKKSEMLRNVMYYYYKASKKIS